MVDSGERKRYTADQAPGDVKNTSTEQDAHRIDRHLVAGLVRMLDWLDNSLQHVLESRGFSPVHRTQSLILIHIASGVENPAEIAREMGSTRQNIHHMARSLIDAGLVDQWPDPTDPRRSVYRLTESSSDVRDAAIETLHSLEKVMMARAGVTTREMNTFRKILAADFGEEIRGVDELNTAAKRRRRSNAKRTVGKQER